VIRSSIRRLIGDALHLSFKRLLAHFPAQFVTTARSRRRHRKRKAAIHDMSKQRKNSGVGRLFFLLLFLCIKLPSHSLRCFALMV
jgi:hypothetical protein